MSTTFIDPADSMEIETNIIESEIDASAVSDQPNRLNGDETQTETKLSVVISEDVPSETTVPTSTYIPSLKGKLVSFNGATICKGCWAMSDAAHEQPGQTSDFEFKLVKANEGSTEFPSSGKYQGWFALKQAPPMKGSLKIEDKEMTLTFSNNENSLDYKIVGQGHNKFGSFNLFGSMTQSGDVHLYREYYNLAPLSTPHSKRKQSFSGDPASSDAKKKSASTTKPKLEISSNTAAAPGSATDLLSPPALIREGSGRVRKMSSLMREYEDTHAATQASKAAAAVAVKPPSTTSSSSAATKAPAAAPSLVRQESTSERAQRLSAPLKKCGDLLKEMAKHPQAVWFLEPVDYVKFNIPDYPSIIKQPMDFRTIRLALEALKYDSHEAFAEHVRLVFRNAMTFNQQRDNPVHIAAREMSARFEDRYRQLTTQIGQYSNNSVVDSIPELKRQSSVASHSGAGRPSLGGAAKKKGPTYAASKQAAPGPRPAPAVGYLPSAGDSSSHQIMEMQRMMAAMQEEISSLRSAVRENEIVKRLNETKDAAHNPLTFDEKKKLIAQIHKLPPNKMEQVLEIIQAAIPKNENGEDGEIEVPLDALDTFTLRKLQKFIEDNTAKKRPPSFSNINGGAGAPTLQRQSSTSSSRGEPTAKKPRKSSTPKSPGAANALLMGGGDDSMLFDHDELLFSTDCFDDIRGGGGGSNGHGSGSNAQSSDAAGHQQQSHFSFDNTEGNNGQQSQPLESRGGRPRAGSLDEDFGDLMSPGDSNHAAPVAVEDINVDNADAWVTSAAQSAESAGTSHEEGDESADMWNDARAEVLARKSREEQGARMQF